MTMTTPDPFAAFKQVQRAGWAFFTPLQAITTATAARLVKHARIRAAHRVLDVGCGTGVVAVTAARLGANVTGLDLTPELLAEARENSRIATVDIDWHEGDVEHLPFDAGTFDIVVSQFGHMFAPRPDVAVSEMLRVIKPGGTIAFSTWPPELFVGRMFALIGNYMPPPPPGVAPPPQWGDPNIVRQRLGDSVREIVFDRATMRVPTLSPQHSRAMMEGTAAPVIKLVETLSETDAEKLARFRREYEAMVVEFLDDNILRQDYLMTRAVKI
jgi:SAM-dependent methyltransferase